MGTGIGRTGATCGTCHGIGTTKLGKSCTCKGTKLDARDAFGRHVHTPGQRDDHIQRRHPDKYSYPTMHGTGSSRKWWKREGFEGWENAPNVISRHTQNGATTPRISYRGARNTAVTGPSSTRAELERRKMKDGDPPRLVPIEYRDDDGKRHQIMGAMTRDGYIAPVEWDDETTDRDMAREAAKAYEDAIKYRPRRSSLRAGQAVALAEAQRDAIDPPMGDVTEGLVNRHKSPTVDMVTVRPENAWGGQLEQVTFDPATRTLGYTTGDYIKKDGTTGALGKTYVYHGVSPAMATQIQMASDPNIRRAANKGSDPDNPVLESAGKIVTKHFGRHADTTVFSKSAGSPRDDGGEPSTRCGGCGQYQAAKGHDCPAARVQRAVQAIETELASTAYAAFLTAQPTDKVIDVIGTPEGAGNTVSNTGRQALAAALDGYNPRARGASAMRNWVENGTSPIRERGGEGMVPVSSADGKHTGYVDGFVSSFTAQHGSPTKLSDPELYTQQTANV